MPDPMQTLSGEWDLIRNGEDPEVMLVKQGSPWGVEIQGKRTEKCNYNLKSKRVWWELGDRSYWGKHNTNTHPRTIVGQYAGPSESESGYFRAKLVEKSQTAK